MGVYLIKYLCICIIDVGAQAYESSNLHLLSAGQLLPKPQTVSVFFSFANALWLLNYTFCSDLFSKFLVSSLSCIFYLIEIGDTLDSLMSNVLPLSKLKNGVFLLR